MCKTKVTALINLTVVILLISACAGEITRINVLNTAPPHRGSVEIRVYPQTSNGKVLFEMVTTNPSGITGIPTGSLKEAVLKKTRELGGNVVIFRCAAPGSIHFRVCHATGFLED